MTRKIEKHIYVASREKARIQYDVLLMFQKIVQPHCTNKLATMILQFIPPIYIA